MQEFELREGQSLEPKTMREAWLSEKTYGAQDIVQGEGLSLARELGCEENLIACGENYVDNNFLLRVAQLTEQLDEGKGGKSLSLAREIVCK